MMTEGEKQMADKIASSIGLGTTWTEAKDYVIFSI